MRDPWAPYRREPAPLPPGLRVAGLGSRIGAWLIDSLILVAFQVCFWIVALGVGAVELNPDAAQQLQASPLVMPSVSPYEPNLPLLAAMLAIFVVLNVTYVAACWAFMRGLPGQRMMSLQVGDSATGRNLSSGRAALRSLVAIGVPIGGLAAAFYGTFAYVGSVPWPEVVNPQPGGQAEAWLSRWEGPLDLSLLLAVGWPILLLIWTAASPRRQGLHDRLARSLVVAKTVGSRAGAYRPGFGPTYGAPPMGMPPGSWAPRGVSGTDAKISQGAMPGGVEPGGTQTPGVLPPGVLPPGFVPPGVLPPSVLPPGFVPPDQEMPWTTTEPSSPTEDPEPIQGEGFENGWGHYASETKADEAGAIAGATVGRRAAAYLIDCAVVLVAFLVLGAIVQVVLQPQITTATTLDERTSIFVGLVGGAAQLAYFTVGWAVWRCTLGQRMLHLRVEDAATGKPLAWIDAVVRWAVIQGPFALASIVPQAVREPILLAAPLWLIVLSTSTQNDPNLRGLHDRFLNSKVVLDI